MKNSASEIQVNNQEKSKIFKTSLYQDNTGSVYFLNRVLRIFADNYDKKSLIIYWLIFCAILIAMFLLTMALPQTFISFQNSKMTQGTNVNHCLNPIGFDVNGYLKCGTISNSTPIVGLFLKDLNSKYQFGLVYINFNIKNSGDTQLNFEQNVTITFYSLTKQQRNDADYYKKDALVTKQQIKYKIVSQQATRFYQNDGYTIGGYYTFFGYMKYINYQNYFISFQFSSWPIYNVNDSFIDITLVNPQFTVFTIVLRYFFFGFTLATSILYYFRYRTIPQSYRSLQQKLVLLLSILTVCFNDPLYPATVLAPNGFTSFTSVAFVCNLIAFLIVFWMIFIERILHQHGQKHQNVITWKKIAYFLTLYITILVLNCLLAFLRMSDEPIIQSSNFNNGAIAVFQIMAIIILIFGFVYIVIQFVRCCQYFSDKMWRNQMFLVFSAFFIFVLASITISNGFGVFQYAGNRVLMLFTTMNMYTIYLQYMYSITDQQQVKILKDYHLQLSHEYQAATDISDFGRESIEQDLDREQPHRVYNFQKQTNNQVLKEKDQIEDRTNANLGNFNNQKDKQSQQNSYKENMFQIQDQ